MKAFLEKQRHSSCRRYSIEYKKVKLGDVCEYIRGVTYSKNDESSSGIAVLRANNVELSGMLNLTDIKYVNRNITIKNKQMLRKNDILMCAGSGSKEHIGKVAFIHKDMNMAFGGFMAVIRNKNDIDSYYLYNILQSKEFREYIDTALTSSTINNMKSSVLYDYSVELPPLEHQLLISSLLSSYDSLIATVQSEQDSLMKIKSQLMTDIFS